uniref:Secreted protein n=1 Tax=Tanacetum cinerariifolium TaxID=118510 RepID=A0A699KNS7_TANCI|nr:hypothetical protein [Tanacetum cinerariifolium]
MKMMKIMQAVPISIQVFLALRYLMVDGPNCAMTFVRGMSSIRHLTTATKHPLTTTILAAPCSNQTPHYRSHPNTP